MAPVSRIVGMRAVSGCWWSDAIAVGAQSPTSGGRDHVHYDILVAMRIVFALLVLAAACDSKAKASDPGAHAEKAKELESCSTSSQCADELKCFDRECRRSARSMVGDYFAAVGANARVKGDIEAQSVQVYANILTALRAVAADWSNVVQFTSYLTRAEDAPAFRA